MREIGVARLHEVLCVDRDDLALEAKPSICSLAMSILTY